MSRALWLLSACLLFLLARPAVAQLSPGNSCSASGQVTLSNKAPAYLLACNGSSWALGEAISSSGLVGFGTTTPLSAVSVSGGVAIGTTYAGTNAAASNNLIVQGSVGIGTTTPKWPLQVGTDLAFTYNWPSMGLNEYYNGVNEVYLTTNTAGLIQQDYTDGGMLLQVSPSGTAGSNISTVYSALFIKASNGNVGIGTTAPQTALDINGSLSFNGAGGTGYVKADTLNANGFDFNFGGGGTFLSTSYSLLGTADIFFQGMPITTAGYTYLEGWNSAGLVLGTGGTSGTTAPIIFRPNRAEAMRITSTGTVGIGTASPGEKLTVSSGNIALDTGQKVLFNGAGDGNWVMGRNTGLTHTAITGNALDVYFSGNSGEGFAIGGGGGGAASFEAYGGSGNIYMRGNVGIGTTSPQAILDVSGYIRLAKNSSQPVACSSTNDGAVALTHVYTLCICKGGSTSWVQSKDGTTACSW